MSHQRVSDAKNLDNQENWLNWSGADSEKNIYLDKSK